MHITQHTSTHTMCPPPTFHTNIQPWLSPFIQLRSLSHLGLEYLYHFSIFSNFVPPGQNGMKEKQKSILLLFSEIRKVEFVCYFGNLEGKKKRLCWVVCEQEHSLHELSRSVCSGASCICHDAQAEPVQSLRGADWQWTLWTHTHRHTVPPEIPPSSCCL